MGSILASAASVISALVGVYLGHQLHERSTKKEWKRQRLSQQAEEVRRWVRFCVATADAASWLAENPSGNEEAFQRWVRETEAVLHGVAPGVTYASLVFLFVDDDLLLGLLQEMQGLMKRYDYETINKMFETRCAPEWAEDVKRDMREVARKVDARLVELMAEM